MKLDKPSPIGDAENRQPISDTPVKMADDTKVKTPIADVTPLKEKTTKTVDVAVNGESDGSNGHRDEKQQDKITVKDDHSQENGDEKMDVHDGKDVKMDLVEPPTSAPDNSTPEQNEDNTTKQGISDESAKSEPSRAKTDNQKSQLPLESSKLQADVSDEPVVDSEDKSVKSTASSPVVLDSSESSSKSTPVDSPPAPPAGKTPKSADTDLQKLKDAGELKMELDSGETFDVVQVISSDEDSSSDDDNSDESPTPTPTPQIKPKPPQSVSTSTTSSASTVHYVMQGDKITLLAGNSIPVTGVPGNSVQFATNQIRMVSSASLPQNIHHKPAILSRKTMVASKGPVHKIASQYKMTPGAPQQPILISDTPLEPPKPKGPSNEEMAIEFNKASRKKLTINNLIDALKEFGLNLDYLREPGEHDKEKTEDNKVVDKKPEVEKADNMKPEVEKADDKKSKVEKADDKKPDESKSRQHPKEDATVEKDVGIKDKDCEDKKSETKKSDEKETSSKVSDSRKKDDSQKPEDDKPDSAKDQEKDQDDKAQKIEEEEESASPSKKARKVIDVPDSPRRSSRSQSTKSDNDKDTEVAAKSERRTSKRGQKKPTDEEVAEEKTSKVKEEEKEKSSKVKEDEKDKETKDDDKEEKTEDVSNKETKDEKKTDEEKMDVVVEKVTKDDEGKDKKPTVPDVVVVEDDDKPAEKKADEDKDADVADHKEVAKKLRPVAKFLYFTGLDLSREVLYNDLVSAGDKKHKALKLHGSEIHDLQQLKKLLLSLRKKNQGSRFRKLRYCKTCPFSTESRSALYLHQQQGHVDDRTVRWSCALCDFESRVVQAFIFHMECDHNMKAMPLPKPQFFLCTLCYYNSSTRAHWTKHMAKCEKQFIPEKHQFPTYDDINFIFRALPGPLIKVPVIAPIKPKPVPIPVQNRFPAQGQRFQVLPPGAIPIIPGNFVHQQRAGAQTSLRYQYPTTSPIIGKPPPLKIGQMIQQTANNKSQFISQMPPLKAAGSNQLRRGTAGGTDIIMSSSSSPIVIGGSSVTSSSIAGAKRPATDPASFQQSAIKPKSSKYSYEVCEICGGFVLDRCALRLHFSMAHNIQVREDSLNPNRQPPLSCDFCAARFWTFQGLSLHKSRSNHVRADQALCHICNSLTSDMPSHIKTAHNIVPNQLNTIRICPICGKAILTEKTEAHIERVHNIKLDKPNVQPIKPTFKCYQCAAKFTEKSLLQMHIRKEHIRSDTNTMRKCSMCSATVMRNKYSQHVLVSHCKRKLEVKLKRCDGGKGVPVNERRDTDTSTPELELVDDSAETATSSWIRGPACVKRRLSPIKAAKPKASTDCGKGDKGTAEVVKKDEPMVVDDVTAD